MKGLRELAGDLAQLVLVAVLIAFAFGGISVNGFEYGVDCRGCGKGCVVQWGQEQAP